MAKKIVTAYLMVELPWPDRDLNPNNRLHWAQKARAAKAARADAYLSAQIVKPYVGFINENTPLGSARLFVPPNTGRNSGRYWDCDNLAASLKATQDGIFDYLRNLISEKIDDSQVSLTINAIVNPDYPRDSGQVYYYLYSAEAADFFEIVAEKTREILCYTGKNR